MSSDPTQQKPFDALQIPPAALDQGGPAYEAATRIGILGGSMVSAVCGYLLLRGNATSCVAVVIVCGDT